MSSLKLNVIEGKITNYEMDEQEKFHQFNNDSFQLKCCRMLCVVLITVILTIIVKNINYIISFRK